MTPKIRPTAIDPGLLPGMRAPVVNIVVRVEVMTERVVESKVVVPVTVEVTLVTTVVAEVVVEGVVGALVVVVLVAVVVVVEGKPATKNWKLLATPVTRLFTVSAVVVRSSTVPSALMWKRRISLSDLPLGTSPAV